MKLKILLTFTSFFWLPIVGVAQSEIAFFILGGRDNAGHLAQAYLSPLANAAQANLGNGWLIINDTISSGKINISLQTTVSLTPQKDRYFDVNQLALSPDVHTSQNGKTLSPTALGASHNGQHIVVTTARPQDGEEMYLTEFSLPEGLGLSFIPQPSIQAQIGVFKYSSILLRGLPGIHIDYENTDYYTYMYGVGILQSLNPLIAPLEEQSIHLSFLFTYSHQYARSSLSRTQAWYWHHGHITVLTEEQKKEEWYDGQKLDVKANNYVMQLYISKTVKHWRFYACVNRYVGSTIINTYGRYPRRDIRAKEEEPYYEYFFHDELNPVALSLPHRQWRLGLGFSVQVGAIGLHTEASLSDYKNLSAGISYQF
ncbi:hypothetical protein PZB74_04170 [Porifericola rhodea]|uniref:DUF6588 family protein n=1 Tax=Porifericola rhodea TaxID=930972 RepID=UPI00266685D6|nr:DUF6588 family protein [Porifericola rhodea]WKN32539.1 hypothetical protein PZB74_04170 [Porifericola rhodea]